MMSSDAYPESGECGDAIIGRSRVWIEGSTMLLRDGEATEVVMLFLCGVEVESGMSRIEDVMRVKCGAKVEDAARLVVRSERRCLEVCDARKSSETDCSG
jgi:hypothetical protein